VTWHEELDAIAKANGGKLRPADVVDFAADPKTALHSKFTWDDGEAGRRYRIWEARHLIRVSVKMMPRGEKKYHAWVSLVEDRAIPGGGYSATAKVLSDRQRRQRLLDQALRELERWRERYRELSELADVFAAADKVRGRKRARA
jgi:hypothetical protein